MDLDALVSRFRSDPEFVAKYRSLGDVTAFQKRLRADGYDLTTTEIRMAAGELLSIVTSQLSDADLACVTGGADTLAVRDDACPKCGSHNLGPQSPITAGPQVCGDCGHRWRESNTS